MKRSYREQKSETLKSRRVMGLNDVSSAVEYSGSMTFSWSEMDMLCGVISWRRKLGALG